MYFSRGFTKGYLQIARTFRGTKRNLRDFYRPDEDRIKIAKDWENVGACIRKGMEYERERSARR